MLFPSSKLAFIAGILLLPLAGCVEDAGSGTAAVNSGEAGSGMGATIGSVSGGMDGSSDAPATSAGNDSEAILIDGSSTVWPVSMAMAEGFSDAKVEVAAPSGTSGGFKKFMVGETDINDASRRIKDGEVETCRSNGIEPIELTVAIDGISIVVNKENTWCDSLTFAQLKAMWEPDSKINTWKDLDAEWPDEAIALFGPDGDSGTFEYFTEKVIETKKECRDDYEPATDDNVLVKGVSGNKYALGYFGYGYYLKARKDLKGLAISTGNGDPVNPTAKSIESYEYPLSRPVFIYVNKSRLSDTGMAEFLRFYLGEGQKLVSKAGCVQLSGETLAAANATLEAALAE